MLANLNLALGLTVPAACVFGAGVFVITVFSVNAAIIRAGFLVDAVIALVLWTGFYIAMRGGVSKPSTDVGRVFLWIAHGLLLLSNGVAVTFAPRMAYDFVFKPPSAQPEMVSALAVAVPTCGLLSVGILLARSRQRR
mgnify:CR=1 FL=1